MTRVLQLIQTCGPGGAEKIVYHLATNANSNFEMIVGLLKQGWLYHHLKNSGIKVSLIQSGGSIDLQLIKNLIKLIKKYDINIVHSHLLDMNFYSSIATNICRVPHISTEHGDIHHPSKKSNLKTKIKVKSISLLSDKIIFVSEYSKNEFTKLSYILPRKTDVIYNGAELSTTVTNCNIESKKAAFGIDKDDIVIGNIGNLYPVKGQTYFLRSAKQIIEKAPNTKYLIIGRGELESSLKREAINLGIASRIKFLGFREDVEELLKIMDVFVLSSLSEGLPLSLIEAMANKVPVVCTRVGGMPEVITHGLHGFLVEPKDPESMAVHILEIIRNKSLSRCLAENAYNRFSREHTIEEMVSRYQNIYLSSCKKRKTRS